MASSTLLVAMVFCSRSLVGCCRPKRTSALAARWTTRSAPSIARSSAAEIEHVLPVELEPRRLAGLLRKCSRPGRKVVVADDVVAVGEQPVHQVAGDESGGAGDEDFHGSARRARRTGISRRYWLREKRIRNISLTLRRLPLNNCRRLSPSSRQRMGTSFTRYPNNAPAPGSPRRTCSHRSSGSGTTRAPPGGERI